MREKKNKMEERVKRYGRSVKGQCHAARNMPYSYSLAIRV